MAYDTVTYQGKGTYQLTAKGQPGVLRCLICYINLLGFHEFAFYYYLQGKTRVIAILSRGVEQGPDGGEHAGKDPEQDGV